MFVFTLDLSEGKKKPCFIKEIGRHMRWSRFIRGQIKRERFIEIKSAAGWGLFNRGLNLSEIDLSGENCAKQYMHIKTSNRYLAKEIASLLTAFPCPGMSV